MTSPSVTTPKNIRNIHKFTVDEYQMMYAEGILAQGNRYELINGEIREMTSQLVTVPETICNIHKFTTDEYQMMYAKGILAEGDRYELINGEIREMSPIGRKHVACIIRLVKLFEKKLGDRVMVSAQNSIFLDKSTQPQPDLAILKWRDDFYAGALPTAEDILLIIEVADSTIAYDRDIKMPLYANHGIPEMWLFDLNQEAIEGYSQPLASSYKRMQRYEKGDTLALADFPEVVFHWEDFF